MRKVYFIAILLATIFVLDHQSVMAQSKPDDITGEWLNADKDRRIQMLKATNDTYFAKISWLKKTDDAEYRIGQVVIKGLSFKAGEYEGGQAFSPANGGWVKATAKVKNNNTLDVTGYKYFLSKTRTYTRVK